MAKFKLQLANEEGELSSLVYDTAVSTLTDESGEDIIPNRLLPLRRKMKRVTISLGFSCNMSCSYCLQSKNKKKAYDEDQVKTIIASINTMDADDNIKIEFWGGEPTLYWDEIVSIVEGINFEPKSGYGIITNGTGLTIDKSKWLIDNNFVVSLSHDGQGQNIRGKETLDDDGVKSAVEWLIRHHNSRFSINSVITKDNINTADRREFFRKKLGLTTHHINLGGEGPVYNTEMVLLDKDILHTSIFEDVIGGEGLDYDFYLTTIGMFFNTLIYKTPLEKISTKCGIDKEDNYEILSLDGKKLSCHNYDHSFKINKLSESDKCEKCIVAHLCKSSCPAIDKSSDMFKRNCEIMYSTHTALLRAAISIIFGGKKQLVNYEEIS